MINITKIYLVENCYGDPNKVYIGKTKNNRKYNHSKTYGSQITYTYIDKVNSINHNDWEPLETYWIEQFRQWGFQVMNIRKKGGSGPDFQTEETKQKISKSLKNHSKHYTEEIKLKMKKPKPEGFGYTLGLKLKGISRPDIKGRPSVNKGKISPNKGNKYTWSSESLIKRYKPIIQYTLQKEFIKEWISIKEAKNTLKINNIPLALSGANKTAGGFIWNYKD